MTQIVGSRGTYEYLTGYNSNNYNGYGNTGGLGGTGGMIRR